MQKPQFSSGAVLCGCGSFLPTIRLSNDDIVARGIDTSDTWIFQRTGIKARHFADDGQMTSDLAIAAARDALQDSGIAADTVDAIIVATTTPDTTLPAVAVRVQEALGVRQGFAFDVQAVCSGFVYALALADNFIRLGQAKTALVIGAETLSRILDWQDRTTCVLFGDGAGAVVLRAPDRHKDDANTLPRGILSTHLHSDGRYNRMLCTDGGVSSTKTVGHLRMNGREVFRHAVTNLVSVVEEALIAHSLRPENIDWFVPHQANARIITHTAEKLGLPPDKVVMTIADHANTSAASIPLALTTAARDGRLKHGDLVLLDAMGGGLTWGAALIRW